MVEPEGIFRSGARWRYMPVFAFHFRTPGSFRNFLRSRSVEDCRASPGDGSPRSRARSAFPAGNGRPVRSQGRHLNSASQLQLKDGWGARCLSHFDSSGPPPFSRHGDCRGPIRQKRAYGQEFAMLVVGFHIVYRFANVRMRRLEYSCSCSYSDSHIECVSGGDRLRSTLQSALRRQPVFTVGGWRSGHTMARHISEFRQKGAQYGGSRH